MKKEVLTSTELPKFGQFVAVWQANGKMWSDTYKWVEGVLHMYDDRKDRFMRRPEDIDFLQDGGKTFYQTKFDILTSSQEEIAEQLKVNVPYEDLAKFIIEKLHSEKRLSELLPLIRGRGND